MNLLRYRTYCIYRVASGLSENKTTGCWKRSFWPQTRAPPSSWSHPPSHLEQKNEKEMFQPKILDRKFVRGQSSAILLQQLYYLIFHSRVCLDSGLQTVSEKIDKGESYVDPLPFQIFEEREMVQRTRRPSSSRACNSDGQLYRNIEKYIKYEISTECHICLNLSSTQIRRSNYFFISLECHISIGFWTIGSLGKCK